MMVHIAPDGRGTACRAHGGSYRAPTVHVPGWNNMTWLCMIRKAGGKKRRLRRGVGPGLLTPGGLDKVIIARNLGTSQHDHIKDKISSEQGLSP
jgi:hypothetical protein